MCNSTKHDPGKPLKARMFFIIRFQTISTLVFYSLYDCSIPEKWQDEACGQKRTFWRLDPRPHGVFSRGRTTFAANKQTTT